MAESRAPAAADPAPLFPRGFAETGVAESHWVSAHIFYQGDLTELVVDGAVPLVREMVSDGLASGWFFLRYWEGGTHLRLRVLPAGGDGNGDAVQALISERLGRYLRERPSAELMQQADYARLAPVLAAREGMASYAESLYPNNSVMFLPYRREHRRYGHGGSIEAVERHFVESSRLATALLASWREHGQAQRDTVAFSLILLTWLVCQPDPARLADAGGSLYRAWGRGLGEAAFDEHYQRRRDQLADLARGVRDIAARLPRDAGHGVLARWGTSALRLRDALAREVAAGRFTPPIRRHPRQDVPARSAPGTPQRAAFGPPGPGGDRPAPTTLDDLHSRVLPVLDICAHLLCNRLGIPLVEESYLRYLATRSATVLAEEGN